MQGRWPAMALLLVTLALVAAQVTGCRPDLDPGQARQSVLEYYRSHPRIYLLEPQNDPGVYYLQGTLGGTFVPSLRDRGLLVIVGKKEPPGGGPDWFGMHSGYYVSLTPLANQYISTGPLNQPALRVADVEDVRIVGVSVPATDPRIQGLYVDVKYEVYWTLTVIGEALGSHPAEAYTVRFVYYNARWRMSSPE